MSELDEFKKVVSPIAYGLAYKSELGTTEYQQLYAEEDVIKYFNNKPQLTIPKSIADELEEKIEEAYSSDYIRSYSDVGAYMEVITDGLDEESELYKFMFPDDALLGCSHRNIIYLYLVDNDLVKVVEA
ncbi:uncharacterized protein LLCC_1694 [Lactococcus cremoris]|uniref:Uncharacterized protein n=1 Tax=Lactococcus lactis subsp. cremoris TaxID=1359 RepID=A0AAD1JWV2_LACLC|nr:hypothetical protein [Lactococcus cremoris]BBC76070.1 uncharacterized protein LLCC_1694 [Lactococcus cremoris]BCO02188.1 hypothetical protein LLG32_02820 [Lactococcus cremoris]BCO05150.1 hypothetical protein LLC_03900 [Lactococcus cremoris]